MAQADYVVANQTFPNTRAEINTIFQAVVSNNAGNSAPSDTFANQWWFDSDDNKLYMRNKDNDAWVSILSIGASSDSVETIHCTSGSITIDSAARIDLSADDNGEIRLFDGSSMYGQFKDDSDNFHIQSTIADKDIHFVGTDGSSVITALRLDMSDSGMAHFNNYIKVADRVVGSGNLVLTSTDANEKIHLDASGFIKFESNGSERMRIFSAGNVSIGTTDDHAKLTIMTASCGGGANSDADELQLEGSGNAGMTICSGNTSSGNIHFADVHAANRGIISYDHSADQMKFGVAGSIKGRFTSAGNFAINDSSTDSKFQSDMDSAGDHYSAFLRHTASSGTIRILRGHFTAQAPDDHTSVFITMGDNSLTRFNVTSDGDVTNHDNAYGSTSDERIKQDIRDSNSQWDDIKAVKVRNYKKKDDVRQYGDNAWEQIGVIAQELEEISPKLIRHNNPDSSDILSDSSFGTLYTADDPETQNAVEEVLYTVDDPETQDVLYTADDELTEGVEVGDVKTKASHNVGDVKIEAKRSTKQIGEVKKVNEQVKSVNYSILYIKAIKALQEAMDRIETLESKVATLEGE